MNISLLPMPRNITYTEGQFVFADGHILIPSLSTCLREEFLFIASQLKKVIKGSTHHVFDIRVCGTTQPAIRFLIDEKLPNEAYRLVIIKNGITITGSKGAGIFYGVQTLIQLLRQCGNKLPCLEIQDFPDIPHRGVMLDISRDKVPTMESLYKLVDTLAEWKINEFQLYIEHTFAYSRHEEVWANASPMTHEEILKLDAYCRQRYIELVPNQNSFGHLERWLRLPNYIDMAEASNGSIAWGTPWEGPFSICPSDPRALDFIGKLYDEYLPHFTSRRLNVGCDETFDLGQGKSKQDVEARGQTRVYLDFLLKIHKLVQERNHTMMFWGDIILHDPALVSELPKDIIALKWGYDGDISFDKDSAIFKQAGVPFYVCPGTSTWNSIAGRTDNALSNLLDAAEAAVKHGALGYLNTEWGDVGHLQYLPASYTGYAAGAAYSWCLEANRKLDKEGIAAAINTHAFYDEAGVMGQLVMELGNMYKQLKIIPNTSRLFEIFISRHEKLPEDVTMPQLDNVIGMIDDLLAQLPQVRMNRTDAHLLLQEFTANANMLRHAARRGRWMLDKTSENPRDLAADMRIIMGHHRNLWLTRNRIGGLSDSLNNMQKTLELYA